MKLNTYLNFNGQCEAAFKFYKQCLGGEIVGLYTYGESPMAGQVPAEAHGKILHVSLKVGDALLFGSDSPQEHPAAAAGGFSVSVGLDDPAEAERIFHALAEGGTVKMPIQETFWAVRFGMLVDRFGMPWMINCEAPA